MNYLVTRDKDGGTAVLTTDAPGSRYGIPVLRIEADDVKGDFGPADLIDARPMGDGFIAAARVVAGWAADAARTPAEREAARRFCGQWQEGPQVTP
jgi:hypothetical protein